jgi:hypothetical protein
MNNTLRLGEIDCIFLSYDEPNAELNYADLLNKAPWAKRVHGVKGSDAAHKACADASDTERFITVDGDNIVDPAFFDLEINLDDFQTGAHTQLSWAGKNHINGLVYGNGGLKCWTRDHVWSMRTHEAAEDDTNQVDFCWDAKYHHVPGCYSVVHNNASPLQAFRAGFREGVKMSLLNGVRLTEVKQSQVIVNFKKIIPVQNYQRLLVWQSVGADVKNGSWAIYGARLGCYMTNCTSWDYRQVKDFDYLNQLFDEHQSYEDVLDEKIVKLGEEIQSNLNLPIANFNQSQSLFFKLTYNNLPRSAVVANAVDVYTTDISSENSFDIVFISNGESNAEENWQRLNACAGGHRIHRVNGVQGIGNAHHRAAELATTSMFYVVDADAWIVDTFKFDASPDTVNERLTYVYHSINPVNDLCYGYGGVKLFSKAAFSNPDKKFVDMTTTIGYGLAVVPVISNITKFNTDAFSSWRSAFRECAKLSSQTINNQVLHETEQRLQTWLTKGDNISVLRGARAGHSFGTSNKGTDQMQLINDYDFLKQQYDLDNDN